MIITKRYLTNRIKVYQSCANNIIKAIDDDTTLSGTKIKELHISYNDAVSKIELLDELIKKVK